MKVDKNSRREFIKKMVSFAALPALLTFSSQLLAQEKKKKKAEGATAAGGSGLVDVNDPTAKALGYVEKSPHKDKHCGNCILYSTNNTACGAKVGPCQVLPGKGNVKIEGYCNSWNVHPKCKT